MCAILQHTLAFIDMTYGRLSPRGIYSYAQSPRQHIKISEVKFGSFEIAFTKLASDLVGARSVIVIGLLLKYLPVAIEKGVNAYRDYEEGRLVRVKRKQIKLQMLSDAVVKQMSNERQNQLVKLLDQLYDREAENIVKAKRFNAKNVEEVHIETVAEPDS